MDYYNSFMNISNGYKEEILKSDQATINEDFKNSPTWHNDIEQEIKFGTLKFRRIEARIERIMDTKVGDSDRRNDDYRKITFSDNSFKPELGSRYKFENNVWLVYSTNTTKNIHSSCYIRRCNNTINVQDKYGNVHQEPCVLSIKPTKSGIKEQEYMSVPIARQVLMYQLNQWTEPLFINSRIMFNHQVYKIGSIMEADRTETFNSDSVKLIKCYVDDDLYNEFDNKELQVADYRVFDYSIKSKDNIMGLGNSKGTIKASVTLNGECTEEPVAYFSSDEDIIKIDKYTGEYHLIENGEAELHIVMCNNHSICKTIPVKVSNSQIPIENDYKTFITPELTYIPLNATQDYEVYEELSCNKIGTKFDISVSGMDSKYYNCDIGNNKISITNLFQNENELLEVKFVNLRDKSEHKLFIELGGLF